MFLLKALSFRFAFWWRGWGKAFYDGREMSIHEQSIYLKYSSRKTLAGGWKEKKKLQRERILFRFISVIPLEIKEKDET